MFFLLIFVTLNMTKLVCMKKTATTCFFLDVVVCLLFLCLGLSLRAWGTPAVRHIGDDGTTFTTDYYKPPFAPDENLRLARSRINYKPVAKSLTEGCQSDYEKIRAIYQWMCATIDYDTSYRIHSADSCFRFRKGVCQAYCELFYRIATAAGVRVEIVEGKAKGYNNVELDTGHGWIFAYTRKDHGILLDPAWGAGGVNGSTFIRRDNPWIWFNVAPERLIMSHYPDDISYQLLDKPVTFEEFIRIPYPNELWFAYGLDAHELLGQARDNRLAMPLFFNGGEGRFHIIDIPLSPTLRIGQFYTFSIKMTTKGDFALMNKDDICPLREWTDKGNGVYSIQFMPKSPEALSLNLKDGPGNAWSTIVKYNIEPPTADDWQNVEKHYPLSIPEAKSVRNLDAKGWELFGVDGQTLLKWIRETNTNELPVTHTERGQRIRIVSVPMTKQLKVGTPYEFRFFPESRGQWALINNSSWFDGWTVDDDGLYSITFTPTSEGSLSLFLKAEGSDSFLQCLEYSVAE